MKKLAISAVAAALLLTAGTGSALAAGHCARAYTPYRTCSHANGVCYFVDANKDGVCDNSACNHANGVCSYVDANKDGVCDNYGAYCAPHYTAPVYSGHHGGGHHGCRR